MMSQVFKCCFPNKKEQVVNNNEFATENEKPIPLKISTPECSNKTSTIKNTGDLVQINLKSNSIKRDNSPSIHEDPILSILKRMDNMDVNKQTESLVIDRIDNISNHQDSPVSSLSKNIILSDIVS